MKSFSVGIGVTNSCNFNCAHCYSREEKKYDLSYSQVENLIKRISIQSINFGTGENILNPDFIPILNLIFDNKIKCSLTSNGYSVLKLPDDVLKKFNDVDISIDFGHPFENDFFRSKGSFSYAIKAINKLLDLGVEVSIVSCMTNKNFSEFGRIFEFVKYFDINLRINIYKPIYNDNLSLSYDQFWNGIKYVFSYGDIIACSEPVVNTVIQDKRIKIGCNCGKNSFRVRPSNDVVPCVYWGESSLQLDDISVMAIEGDEQFERIRMIPEFCKDCEDVKFCEGGCASRRYYNDIAEPDPYCYRYAKKEKPELTWNFADSLDLVHANYLCTLILR